MIQVNKRFLMQGKQMRLKLFVKVQDKQTMLKLSLKAMWIQHSPPIPEVPEDEWGIRPGFFEEGEEEEDTGPMEEDIFSQSRTPERRVERHAQEMKIMNAT